VAASAAWRGSSKGGADRPPAPHLETIARRLVRGQGDRRGSRHPAQPVAGFAPDGLQAAAVERLGPPLAQRGAAGTQLLRRQAAWRGAQARLDAITVYCRRVAANLGPATFAEQRKRIAQLRVRVEVYRADHSPRWIATSEIIPEAATDSNVFNAA
jgi:hypothetical protein